MDRKKQTIYLHMDMVGPRQIIVECVCCTRPRKRLSPGILTLTLIQKPTLFGKHLCKCVQALSKGVPTPTLQPVCNWYATRKKLKLQSGCKGRGEFFFKSPTSCRLKSVASCLLNMHKRLAATEFDREEVA